MNAAAASPLDTVASQLVARATPLVGQLASTPIAALSDERLLELGARIVAILALRSAAAEIRPPAPPHPAPPPLSAPVLAPVSLAAWRRGATHAAMSHPEKDD